YTGLPFASATLDCRGGRGRDEAPRWPAKGTVVNITLSGASTSWRSCTTGDSCSPGGGVGAFPRPTSFLRFVAHSAHVRRGCGRHRHSRDRVEFNSAEGCPEVEDQSLPSRPKHDRQIQEPLPGFDSSPAVYRRSILLLA